MRAKDSRTSGHLIVGATLLGSVLLSAPGYGQLECFDRVSPAGASRDFGTHVAIDDDTLVVLSDFATFVFDRRGEEWIESASLPRDNNFTGPISLSGDRILVGGRETRPVVWRRSEMSDDWSVEGTLAGGTQPSYGQYSALSGELAAVTELETDTVHFFRRAEGGWIKEDEIQLPEIRGWVPTLFGWNVVLDGDRAVTGAWSPGTAVVMRRRVENDTASWVVEDALRPSDECEVFGAGLAIDGDVIVVGSAPDFARPSSPCRRAYVFRFDPNAEEWVEEQTLTAPEIVSANRFGGSVSVQGNRIAIGEMAHSEFESGSGFGTVYSYHYLGDEWRLVGKHTPTDQNQNDDFARTVAVAGGTIVAGSRRAEAAYVLRPGASIEITMSPERPLVGEEVTFEATGIDPDNDAPIVEYQWDFGDGLEKGAATITRSFDEAGRHLVSLSATDANDRCSSAFAWAIVGCPPTSHGVAPWTSGDVGAPLIAGSSNFEEADDSRELVLCAGGAGLSRSEVSDGFHFVYRELSGDVALTARVRAVEGGSVEATAGVILRENLDSGARFVGVLLDPRRIVGGFRFLRREETSGESTRTKGDFARLPDTWVQIRREGNEFIGLSSFDGERWAEIDRVSLDFPDTILVGVAAGGSGDERDQSFSSVRARVSNIELSPAQMNEPTFRRGDPNADGTLNIADGVAVLEILFGTSGQFGCSKSADANDDGATNIADALYIFNFLFGDGPALPPPSTECGEDPTPDDLVCEEHAACA